MQRRIFHDCPMWLTVLLLLFLCGCSATRLGYQNADWFLKRGLSDYIDFNDTQTQYLDKSLTQLMEWHCQTQLPRYIHWLERVEQTATTSPVSRNEVSHRVNELGDFLQDIAFQITPPTTALLSQLSDRQITQLSDRITTRQLALEKKHLTPSLEKQAEQRAKRLEKRLKRWLGPLTTEQRERIRAWSQAQPDRNHHWLENRKHWQMALLQAVKSREQINFPKTIAELLQRPSRIHPPQWQPQNLAYHAAAVDLATDLLNMTNTVQKNHLKRTVAGLKADFSALSCAP